MARHGSGVSILKQQVQGGPGTSRRECAIRHAACRHCVVPGVCPLLWPWLVRLLAVLTSCWCVTTAQTAQGCRLDTAALLAVHTQGPPPCLHIAEGTDRKLYQGRCFRQEQRRVSQRCYCILMPERWALRPDGHSSPMAALTAPTITPNMSDCQASIAVPSMKA